MTTIPRVSQTSYQMPALRAAPSSVPMAASSGGMAMSGGANPYLMAASGALDAVGKMADYQMQKRQYNLNKQAMQRSESQDLLDRMNAQRMQAGSTPGKAYLLKQMAMRLGLGDMPIQATRQLVIKPMSGTTRVDQQFQNYYGMDKNAMMGKPPAMDPRNPRAVSDMLVRSLFGGR